MYLCWILYNLKNSGNRLRRSSSTSFVPVMHFTELGNSICQVLVRESSISFCSVCMTKMLSQRQYTITGRYWVRVTLYWLCSEQQKASGRVREVSLPPGFQWTTPLRCSKSLYRTVEYGAHFYNMYVNKHTRKQLTGDYVCILQSILPFRDHWPLAVGYITCYIFKTTVHSL